MLTNKEKKDREVHQKESTILKVVELDIRKELVYQNEVVSFKLFRMKEKKKSKNEEMSKKSKDKKLKDNKKLLMQQKKLLDQQIEKKE